MAQTDASTNTNAPGVMTGKPLIESDRVEGTAVYDRKDNHIGSIKRLMIEKKTGQVAYTGDVVRWVPRHRRRGAYDPLEQARL